MGNKLQIGVNDLKTWCKQNGRMELLIEWNYEKNTPYSPETITYGSSKKAWWKCLQGHEWESPVSNRTRGRNCPFCSGKKLIIGVNDLSSRYPNIAKEWHPTKNNGITPHDVMYGSTKRAWWKCVQGHEWETSINSRTNKNTGCPYCSKNTYKPGINDLQTNYPDLAKEWHPTKNVPSTPANVASGSKHKVWWLGKCGHEWEAVVYERAINRTGCPYCKNKVVLTGFNDLQTKYPELAKEWHPTKNGSLIPSEVLFGSDREVWWRCEKGHEWKANIYSRTKIGRGCPKCALETQTSFPEQAVFFYVSKIFNNVENRYIIDSFEIDVYIPEIKTGIEYDGRFYHSSTSSSKREIKKYNSLRKKGIRLIRIKESDDNKVVNDIIYYKYSSNYRYLRWAISSLFHLLEINSYDIDIAKDRNAILEQYVETNKKNSLAEKYPDIAKEWNFDKNLKLTPSMFSYSSNKRVWWKCSKGHEWESTINERTSRPSVCPYCSGKRIIVGINDLATINPELAKEWNYDKNNGLTPRDVSTGSQNKVWWKCSKGHEWEAVVYSRALNKTGCPVCSGKKALAGYNDLETINSKLAKEWNYERNYPLLPSQVTAGSHKEVWWICSTCGNTWLAVVKNRNNGTGCPYCSGRNVLIGINDLATVNPSLAQEWNYEKNDSLTPSNVSFGSKKKVWWKCSQGHEWEADVCSRNNGNGCPFCSNVVPKPVINLDTGEVFANQSIAAKSCGISSSALIGYVCKGKRKTAGGFHWKYVD